ncbi:MAG: hypothetical protein EU517_01455 [Promethearchaeota archaeon]|nr:MAG: hypothetical protein EU517_01455 [Candidatus Lokiarchaeota archaeon]
MKRMKLTTSLMTTASIALILIFLSTTVLAAAKVRPISDFTDTNNNIAAWGDLDSGLTIFPHGWFVFDFPDAPESIADCNPSGSVLEKELKDGSIMYNVNFYVKGALMAIASDVLLVIGEMDYHFQATLIVYDGELGDPVPNLLEIWFPQTFLPPGSAPIGEGTFSHLTGKGTGKFVNIDAAVCYGFDPDEEVKVKVNQVGILRPDEEYWPVELVFFH